MNHIIWSLTYLAALKFSGDHREAIKIADALSMRASSLEDLRRICDKGCPGVSVDYLRALSAEIPDPDGLTREEMAIQLLIKDFAARAIRMIKSITVEDFIEKGGANPFLIAALQISDFEELARFYTYQRVGRSILTSFGFTLEKVIRTLSKGRKGRWWDIETKIGGKKYYISVKSGPYDMDKDQVEHFADRAEEVTGGVPIIAITYGKQPSDVIKRTLEDRGLSVSKNLYIGRGLYALLTGQNDYYRRLLEVIGTASAGVDIISLIEEKARELAVELRRRYHSMSDFLSDMF
ncbi:hypothetical protein DRO54_08580 [Candidatus Bathyarchaeota archaeon]|nr:MAG: hypothetical protein DRO54_08580 [Candidatus Bathyarchaeota archaeon]